MIYRILAKLSLITTILQNIKLLHFHAVIYQNFKKGVTHTMNEEINPFDSSAESSELQALQAELEQNAQSIESDFAKYAAEKLTADDEELFFENKEAFISKILQMQNEFLETNIAPKQARAQELQGQISKKQDLANFDKAVKEFSQQHPEVNINELMEFLQNEIPPRIQRELEKIQDSSEFINTLYEVYMQANGGAQAQGAQEPARGEALPKQVQGVNREADLTGANQPLPQDRF